MKKVFTLIFISVLASAFSQVGIGTNSPDPSSILEIKSSNKGILIPRVSLNSSKDTSTIPNPAIGLLVYNTNESDGNTPTDTSDDLFKNNFYTFYEGKWHLIVSDVILQSEFDKLGVPQLLVYANVVTSGNETNYLSEDYNAGIRQFFFGNEEFDREGSYNPQLSEFTAPNTGYYQIETSIFLKYNGTASSSNDVYRLGVSVPYSSWTSLVKDNSAFYFLNQPVNPVKVSNSTDTPLSISASGVVYMLAGQKIRFLTRYISPGTSGNTFTINTESAWGIKRKNANYISISYYPTN